jgi:hypothetical protein
MLVISEHCQCTRPRPSASTQRPSFVPRDPRRTVPVCVCCVPRPALGAHRHQGRLARVIDARRLKAPCDQSKRALARPLFRRCQHMSRVPKDPFVTYWRRGTSVVARVSCSTLTRRTSIGGLTMRDAPNMNDPCTTSIRARS